MLVRDFLVVRSQPFELFLSGLAPGLYPQETLFLKIDPVLVFVTSQATSVDVEVLVFVLSLILAFEPFQVFHVLLL